MREGGLHRPPSTEWSREGLGLGPHAAALRARRPAAATPAGGLRVPTKRTTWLDTYKAAQEAGKSDGDAQKELTRPRGVTTEKAGRSRRRMECVRQWVLRSEAATTTTSPRRMNRIRGPRVLLPARNSRSHRREARHART
jgi:hypothetical protein